MPSRRGPRRGHLSALTPKSVQPTVQLLPFARALRGWRVLLGLVAVSVWLLLSTSVRAGVPTSLASAPIHHTSVVWRPALGLAPETVDVPTTPEALADAPVARGPVEIGPTQRLVIWVDALESIRVRQLGEAGPLRFLRHADAGLQIQSPGTALAPGPGGEARWRLDQPGPSGALWSIEAEHTTTVLVERIASRAARFASVEIEDAVLDWIAAKDQGPGPTLLDPDDASAGAIELQAALARELLALDEPDPALERALRAWRMLAAMATLDRSRPAVRPYYALAPAGRRSLPLEASEVRRLDAKDSRDYRLAQPRRWTLAVKGSGQVRIAARTWAPSGELLEPARLVIRSGQRVLSELRLSAHPASHTLDPDAALPVYEPLMTEAGDPVGEFASATLVVPPGQTELELELVGGPALLDLEYARRLERSLASLVGRTPAKRARAARRGLARTRSSAGPWLELLVDAQTFEPLDLGPDDPQLSTLADRSPLLTALSLSLVATTLEAEDAETDAQISSLAESLWPALAKLDRDSQLDPRARGHLRGLWLAQLVRLRRPDLLAPLLAQSPGATDPIAELPARALSDAAELSAELASETTERPVALALLDLARARSPTDARLGEVFHKLWTTRTRWSRRAPRFDDDAIGAPAPAGEWLVPASAPSATGPATARWQELELGRTYELPVELRPGVVSHHPSWRRRLVDVHITAPEGSREPVRLEVDEHLWWSPMLFGVQRHQLSLAAGTHTLRVDGPPGTRAWSELPAREADEGSSYARVLRMWTLPGSSWSLPGPAIPGHVRLSLRWPSGLAPRPVRITMREHSDDPRQPPREHDLRLTPRRGPDGGLELDASAVPMTKDSTIPQLSPAHELVLPVAAATTRVSFEVEDSLPVLATLAVRRALYRSELSQPGAGAGGPSTSDEDDPTPAFLAELLDLDQDASLAELARLSAVLLAEPRNVDARVRRVALLLALGDTGLARADLTVLDAMLAAMPPSDRAHAEALFDELEQRFHRWIESREVRVSDPAMLREVELVEPAITAYVGERRELLEPWLSTWSELRELSPSDAIAALDGERVRLGADPGEHARELETLAELARAQWLSRDTESPELAARAWFEIYGRLAGAPTSARAPLAIGLAAVAPLLAHLDDPSSDASDAGLAYGLTRELLPHFSQQRVRRLAFVAAMRSEWQTIVHSDDNNGFERLETPLSEVSVSPGARVIEAMLASPWAKDPNSGQTLRAGHKAVLSWDAQPGTVTAEVWCRALRTDLAPQRSASILSPELLGKANMVLRLRGPDGPLADRAFALGEAESIAIELPVVNAARHRLELVASPDRMWTCTWRARTRGVEGGPSEPVEANRRRSWSTAGPGRSADFTLLGPAHIEIDARAIDDGEIDIPPQLIVELEPLDAGPEQIRRGQVKLDGAIERPVRTEARRYFKLTHARAITLLLTEARPYRVRMHTDQGRALVRLRRRHDRGELPPPARVSLREFNSAELEVQTSPSYSLGQPEWRDIAESPPEPRNRVGTLSLTTRAGLDELGDADDFRLRFETRVSASYHRELITRALWLNLGGQLRARERSPLAGGGHLGLSARLGRSGLRVGVLAHALAQPLAGRAEANIGVSSFIDRPTWLGRHVQLRPRLDFRYRWQSLTPERLATLEPQLGELEPHPRTYLEYVHNHPLVLRPELGLRVIPLQDLALWTRASVTPNSDLRDLDHVDAELGLDGIGREPRAWIPWWGASYQASVRLSDDDRNLSYVRHLFAAELGVGVWARDAVRVSLGVRNRVYLSPIAPVRDVFELWLRLDGAFGRRMRDFGPGDLWFREGWAPRAWGAEPGQAPSTRGRIPRVEATPGSR